jgi:hypothetical protein
MAKHKHQTLLEAGMLENTIAGMVKTGLLRYDSDTDMLWTLKPPSKWSKYWRRQWKCSPF